MEVADLAFEVEVEIHGCDSFACVQCAPYGLKLYDSAGFTGVQLHHRQRLSRLQQFAGRFDAPAAERIEKVRFLFGLVRPHHQGQHIRVTKLINRVHGDLDFFGQHSHAAHRAVRHDLLSVHADRAAELPQIARKRVGMIHDGIFACLHKGQQCGNFDGLGNAAERKAHSAVLQRLHAVRGQLRARVENKPEEVA